MGETTTLESDLEKLATRLAKTNRVYGLTPAERAAKQLADMLTKASERIRSLETRVDAIEAADTHHNSTAG